jgi:hypothetical protein
MPQGAGAEADAQGSTKAAATTFAGPAADFRLRQRY